MRRRLRSMRRNPGNFRFEERDPFVEFVLRVRCQIFASESAGCVAFGAGKVFVIHGDKLSDLPGDCQCSWPIQTNYSWRWYR